MEYNKEDFGKSGIYCIRNIQNKKLYVGKAKCIYSRIKQHVTLLNTKNKDENRHLIHAWHKYGREYFEYEVLEYLEFNETLLKERELYWILSKNTLDRNIGYNLRLDSSTGLITSQETRDRLSKASTGRKVKESTRSLLRDRWKDENRLSKMKIALSKSRSRNSILQTDKSGNFVRLWDTMKELLDANPTYKRHNIYAVCSGEKPSMYGYIWRKVPKIQ